MSSQKVIVYLISLVAIGIIVVGLLATILHSKLLAPIPILGLILAVFVLLTNKGNFAHKIENIEKIMFFITFAVIICSFILLYKPI
jgi:energy-converting hydrogenase A subunit K